MEFTDQYILLPGTFLGDIQIRYYGIIIVAAMLLAATVAARLARANGYDSDHIWGGLTWAILPGIVLARLWFVLFPPVSQTAACFDPLLTEAQIAAQCRDTAWYLANFFDPNNGAIAIWSGGLSIFGAVIGGLIGAYLYVSPLHNRVARIFHYIFLPFSTVLALVLWLPSYVIQRVQGAEEIQPFAVPRFESAYPDSGMPILPWLDIAAVALPLAQAVGRWANFINQELYGIPTTLPWGIAIPFGPNGEPGARVGVYANAIDYPPETLFHPLFLYESLWSLAAFFILFRLYMTNRERFRPGDFFLIYVAQYSVIRFLLEFLRIEKAFIGDTMINSSQVFTGMVFVLALVLLLIRRQQPAQPIEMPPVAYNARVHEEEAADRRKLERQQRAAERRAAAEARAAENAAAQTDAAEDDGTNEVVGTTAADPETDDEDRTEASADVDETGTADQPDNTPGDEADTPENKPSS